VVAPNEELVGVIVKACTAPLEAVIVTPVVVYITSYSTVPIREVTLN
jgi:hypothetical protein